MAERKAPENTTDYIEFGDVARDRCEQQCQYAARYLSGTHDYPDLGSDLRWYGDTDDYHFLMIHKDDAEIFVQRYLNRHKVR